MANISFRGASSLINALPKRFASAAAAAQDKPKQRAAALPKEPVRVTKLDNGIVVASLENNSPVTRVAAVVNAGSRDELSNQRGASHALRVYSSLATRNYSIIGVSRNLDQAGTELNVTSTREQTSYLLEGTRRNAARGVDVLGEILSRPEFRHWEVSDASARLDFDLDVYDERADLQFVDLVHKASFAGGLSNSLTAPRFNAHSLDGDVLAEFRRRNFTLNRLTLVGVGIKHDELLRHAELFRLPGPAADYSKDKSRFLPSELRQDSGSELVHFALTAEGVSLSNKDYLAASLASHAFGAGGERIKRSLTNKLARALLPLAGQPASVSSFNISYSDAGLFGFHIVGNSHDIGKLAKGLVKELGNAAKNGLSSKELAAARNSLKFSLSESLDNSHSLIEIIGLSGERANAQTNLNDLYKAVDSVSDNDVNTFVKRVASGKHSLAAIGDLTELPRLAELA